MHILNFRFQKKGGNIINSEVNGGECFLKILLVECTKVKRVKLSLRLISYALCNEDILGNRGRAPFFLTSALDGDEWSASRPCYFSP
jgi:hypothetical protein